MERREAFAPFCLLPVPNSTALEVNSSFFHIPRMRLIPPLPRRSEVLSPSHRKALLQASEAPTPAEQLPPHLLLLQASRLQ